MPPRLKPKWEIRPSDWGLGWVAVILGVISLYLYITSKTSQRERRRIRGGTQARANASSSSDIGGKSYLGWKVLVAFEAFSEDFQINPSEVDILRHLAGMCDLYILCQVESDAAEEIIRNVCEAAGLMKAGLSSCKILFCSTRKGKEAIGRQLAPALYIDVDEDTCGYLAAHLPHVTLIDSSLASTSSLPIPSEGGTQRVAEHAFAHPQLRGVMTSPSITDFFRYLSPS